MNEPSAAGQPHVSARRESFAQVRALATSEEDGAVLMLNLNQYSPAAGFPEGRAYADYMSALHHAVEGVGGKVLWQSTVTQQVIGCEHDAYDEILAVWYPSHSAFVELPKADGADLMFEGRSVCVANATIVSLPGDVDPHQPAAQSQS